jgi:hypothetical protein
MIAMHLFSAIGEAVESLLFFPCGKKTWEKTRLGAC